MPTHVSRLVLYQVYDALVCIEQNRLILTTAWEWAFSRNTRAHGVGDQCGIHERLTPASCEPAASRCFVPQNGQWLRLQCFIEVPRALNVRTSVEHLPAQRGTHVNVRRVLSPRQTQVSTAPQESCGKSIVNRLTQTLPVHSLNKKKNGKFRNAGVASRSLRLCSSCRCSVILFLFRTEFHRLRNTLMTVDVATIGVSHPSLTWTAYLEQFSFHCSYTPVDPSTLDLPVLALPSPFQHCIINTMYI